MSRLDPNGRQYPVKIAPAPTRAITVKELSPLLKQEAEDCNAKKLNKLARKADSDANTLESLRDAFQKCAGSKFAAADAVAVQAIVDLDGDEGVNDSGDAEFGGGKPNKYLSSKDKRLATTATRAVVILD